MSSDHLNRRTFLTRSAQFAAAAGIAPALAGRARADHHEGPPFRISLAQWSLNRSLFGGDLDNLEFAETAAGWGIDAVEYVNQFFFDKAEDRSYLRQMKQRAEDAGVKSLLIMCDNEGNLGDPDGNKRTEAVENHYKWVDAAKFLGCHSIRVNARSSGSWQEQRDLAADGLARLTEYAAAEGLNVIVENHGGLSSHGRWLAEVMETVDHPNCGTLPDFGNFRIRGGSEERPALDYNRYLGVHELMPYAKGVSAKSHDFDDQGNETGTDFFKMMRIVLNAGYNGYVGIEWEGGSLSEEEGIMATKRLLERVREELT